eukprot:CAMPEP_0201575546 /NCGR_PEP_ID=MMETSP0190_2-20130828/20817_1 /ASSEMBLY_ACC=CAM_ASM_000263 /TAXON_ID=37353 /ORGANISM="Rosalina sp." /LENGTH=158 /DNA_ID=CAMNT_0048005317 /DNA_START=337 /DNA_END=813 /DNA_ORIENTATION=-
MELKKDKIGATEFWESVPITKGIEDQSDYRCKVALKPYGSELYLCCHKNGSLALQPHCKSYEQWIVEKEENTGMFSFKSAHNTYLCAESNGKPIGNRKQKKDWEKWRIIVVQDKAKEEQEKKAAMAAKIKQQQQQIAQNQQQIQQQQPGMPVNDGSYY